MRVTDNDRQESLRLLPDRRQTDDGDVSPSTWRALNELQKSFNNFTRASAERSIGSAKMKRQIYAALRVDDRALDTPSSELRKRASDRTASLGDIAGNEALKDPDCRTLNQSRAYQNGERTVLNYLSPKSGVVRFSSRQRISLSRSFNDNFNIDVSDLTPIHRLTTNGKEVVALERDHETALADRIIEAMEDVKAAIRRGDLASPPISDGHQSRGDDEG